MIDKIRFIYRKFILFWIPVRTYVLHSPLSDEEIVRKLHELIEPHRLYFIFGGSNKKVYSGRFQENSFVAIKNHPKSRHRQIKVIGSFFRVDGKTYVRLILSNPFSFLNIAILTLMYLIMLIFRFFPFQGYLLNGLLYLSPLILAYLTTNFSFQAVYRKEKVRFFRLFRGRRLSDEEIIKVGV